MGVQAGIGLVVAHRLPPRAQVDLRKASAAAQLDPLVHIRFGHNSEQVRAPVLLGIPGEGAAERGVREPLGPHDLLEHIPNHGRWAGGESDPGPCEAVLLHAPGEEGGLLAAAHRHLYLEVERHHSHSRFLVRGPGHGSAHVLMGRHRQRPERGLLNRRVAEALELEDEIAPLI